MKLKVLSVVVASLALATVVLADTTPVYNSKASTGTVPRTAKCSMASGMKMDQSMPMKHSMKTDGTKSSSKPMDMSACKAHCGM